MWLEGTDVLDRVMLFLLTMSEAASLLEMEEVWPTKHHARQNSTREMNPFEPQ